MELTPVSRNVTVIGSLQKRLIKIDPLRDLIPGEDAQIFDIPDQGAPLVISYPRAGIQIAFLDQRAQVDVRLLDGARASRGFGLIAKRTMEAIGDQRLTAYGFNFIFACPTNDATPVVDPPSWLKDVDGYEFAGMPFFQVIYGSQGAKYVVGVTQAEPQLSFHVNVHHDADVLASHLAEEIERRYDEDIRAAFELAKRILSHGNGN